MKKFLAIITVLVLITACAYNVKPDSAPSYREKNFLSAEITMCNKTKFGVNGCFYSQGDTTTDKFISIQGYYKGEIEIFSELCNVDIVERYEENELKTFSLAQILGSNRFLREHSCTFKIIVSPDYIDKSTEVVYPRIGKAIVEVVNDGVENLGSYVSEQAKESTSEDKNVEIVLPVKEDGKFLFAGCEGVLQGDVIKGVAVLPPFSRKISCKYQVALRTTNKKYIWGYYRNVYERDTLIMANPAITRKGDELCVEGNQNVLSFVSINNKWKNSHKLCVKYAPGSKVRTFSVSRNTYQVVK